MKHNYVFDLFGTLVPPFNPALLRKSRRGRQMAMMAWGLGELDTLSFCSTLGIDMQELMAAVDSHFTQPELQEALARATDTIRHLKSLGHSVKILSVLPELLGTRLYATGLFEHADRCFLSYEQKMDKYRLFPFFQLLEENRRNIYMGAGEFFELESAYLAGFEPVLVNHLQDSGDTVKNPHGWFSINNLDQIRQVQASNTLKPDEIPFIIRAATANDLPMLEAFLSTPEIDRSFKKPLSEREITIHQRVQNGFVQGQWLLFETSCLQACILVKFREHGHELSTFATRQNAYAQACSNILYEYTLKTFAGHDLLFDTWEGSRAITWASKKDFEPLRVYDDAGKRGDKGRTVEMKLPREKNRFHQAPSFWAA